MEPRGCPNVPLSQVTRFNFFCGAPMRKEAKAVASAGVSRGPEAFRTLEALHEAEAACTRCPLYKFATQVVPGEGLAHSRLMLVGEQPGDKEDVAGKPFVGPAGQPGSRRWKRRSFRAAPSSSPTRSSISSMRCGASAACTNGQMPTDRALSVVAEASVRSCKPAAIVALGATAARSIFDRVVTISQDARHRFTACRRDGGIRHHPPIVSVAHPGRDGQAARISQLSGRPPACDEDALCRGPSRPISLPSLRQRHLGASRGCCISTFNVGVFLLFRET